MPDTDEYFVRDVNSLIDRDNPGDGGLPPAPVKASIGAVTAESKATDVGLPDPSISPSEIEGANLFWPLKEVSRTESVRTLVSDDGLVEIDVADVTSLTVRDADGVVGTLTLRPPS